MATWAADVCSRAARQLICIEPTGLRLRHIGKTDQQCGTVQFCFHSGRLTCSARTGFRAVTTPLNKRQFVNRFRPRVLVLGSFLNNDRWTAQVGVGHKTENEMCNVCTHRPVESQIGARGMTLTGPPAGCLTHE